MPVTKPNVFPITIPKLKRPKHVPKDQEWFWSNKWQAGEKRVNRELEKGEYTEFDNVDQLIVELNKKRKY